MSNRSPRNEKCTWNTMKRRMEEKRREREKDVLKTKKKQYVKDRVKGMVGGGLRKRKKDEY